jgi:hypothetical protein
MLVAAADHCLAAAYRGKCPGVEPDRLMRWRAESRAKFQGRSVEAVLADVERAREALRAAPEIELRGPILCPWHEGGIVRNRRSDDCFNERGTDWADEPCRPAITARDMRGQKVPELSEASAREGLCFIADGLPSRDGRRKVVCQSGSPEQIRAFMETWAPSKGLLDIYGDPERGFAGGYLPALYCSCGCGNVIGVDLRGADLQRWTDRPQHVDLRGVDLRGADLRKGTSPEGESRGG